MNKSMQGEISSWRNKDSIKEHDEIKNQDEKFDWKRR